LGNASVGRVTQGGGDGRVNSPRQHSFSKPFAQIPPFFPQRRGPRLHPSALSPEGYGAGRAVRRTSVHEVQGMLWSYPRGINEALLRSPREFDELVAEDHLFRQL